MPDPVAVQLDRVVEVRGDEVSVPAMPNENGVWDPRATVASVPITATPTVAAAHFFFERETRKTFPLSLGDPPTYCGNSIMTPL